MGGAGRQVGGHGDAAVVDEPAELLADALRHLLAPGFGGIFLNTLSLTEENFAGL